ncbi:hypothetical protein ACFX1W_032354 [Malus domestica]
MISFFTTSIMGGLSWCCASLNGLAPSSKSIRCMQVARLIPLISANVHPMAVLYSRSTLTNLSSSCTVSEEEMMTGSVSCSPKNTYFKWLGNGLSSREGGWITEGSNLLVELGIEIRLRDLPICLGFDYRAATISKPKTAPKCTKMHLIAL